MLGGARSHTVALEHTSSPTSAWAEPGLFLQSLDPADLLFGDDSPSATSCGQGGYSGRQGVGRGPALPEYTVCPEDVEESSPGQPR